MMRAGLHEVWEDGQAFKDLHARMKVITESRANIEAARKVLCNSQHHICMMLLGV